jgi:hypothetical protein
MPTTIIVYTQIINDKNHLNDASSLIFWWSKKSTHLQQTRIEAQTPKKTIKTHPLKPSLKFLKIHYIEMIIMNNNSKS